MDQLIHCSKCHTIPYDVLMMNCNHNLCVKCAIERMQGQHSSKNSTGRFYLQCQKCKTKTNLDEESVAELEKVQKNKGYIQKVYFDKDTEKRVQTPINSSRNKVLQKKQDKKQGKSQIKPQQPQINKNPVNNKKQTIQVKKQRNTIQKSTDKIKTKQQSPLKYKQKMQKQEKNNQQSQKITNLQSGNRLNKSNMQINYGACENHKQQPVMYYCFTCKNHCFCAQCIIHGKHNNHDVKIIKKAYASVQSQLREAIKSTRQYVNELLQRKRQITNDINVTKNRVDSLKRTIEKGFDQVRSIIREKEIQFMKMVDQHYVKLMETNNGVIKKTIDSKLKQQQDLLQKLDSSIKKGQKFVLDLYSDDWSKICQLTKKQNIKLPSAQLSFNEALSDYVSEIKTQIGRIQPKSFQK